MKISEIITDKYKLRIPPTVYYELLADIQEVEEDQEPTTKNNLGVDAVSRQAINGYIDYILSHGMGKKKSFDFIKKFVANLPSITPQEPILDKINKMKSEIADSLEFWDYSPNNNPLARDMLETLTNFWGDMREVKE